MFGFVLISEPFWTVSSGRTDGEGARGCEQLLGPAHFPPGEQRTPVLSSPSFPWGHGAESHWCHHFVALLAFPFSFGSIRRQCQAAWADTSVLVRLVCWIQLKDAWLRRSVLTLFHTHVAVLSQSTHPPAQRVPVSLGPCFEGLLKHCSAWDKMFARHGSKAVRAFLSVGRERGKWLMRLVFPTCIYNVNRTLQFPSPKHHHFRLSRSTGLWC